MFIPRLLFAPAVVATALAGTSASAAAAPAPQLAYLSGGPGNAEVQALKHEGRGFPLNLVFTAGRQSRYLDGVRVDIADEAGRVLVDAVASGPVMLVRLPSGSYRVRAESRYGTIERTVDLDAAGFRRLDFHWRDS